MDTEKLSNMKDYLQKLATDYKDPMYNDIGKLNIVAVVGEMVLGNVDLITEAFTQAMETAKPIQTLWDASKLLFKEGDSVVANEQVDSAYPDPDGDSDIIYTIPAGTPGKVIEIDLNDADTPYRVAFDTSKIDVPFNVDTLWCYTSDID